MDNLTDNPIFQRLQEIVQSIPLETNVKILICIIICILALPTISLSLRNRKMKRLVKANTRYRIDDFLDIRRGMPNSKDYPGVYVIKNHRKHKYYVGQGVNVWHRASKHFNGHGSPDVYRDYKKRHRFSITIVPLQKSGCRCLDDLERYMIRAYSAYTRGYNKTRGNNPHKRRR